MTGAKPSGNALPQGDPSVPGQKLLVAVGPSPEAEKTVRWAAKLAASLNASLLALYVETPNATGTSRQLAVAWNLDLARKLGAEVVTTTDQDVARGILRVARQRGVNQIVAGKPRGRAFGGQTVRRLIRDSEEIQIHLTPAHEIRAPEVPASKRRWNQYLTALSMVAGVTITAIFYTPLIGAHATALVYLLAVALLSTFVERGPALAAAAMSALAWDFFFLQPVLAFQIQRFEDLMLFAMYFVVALVLGHLTSRIRAQEEAEHRREERAMALYLLTRGLNEATTLEGIAAKAADQVDAAFKAQSAIFAAMGQEGFTAYPTGSAPPEGDDLAAAWIAIRDGRMAGRFTDEFPRAEAMYAPLASGGERLGAIRLKLRQSTPLGLQQQNLFEAFSQQIALAMDRLRLSQLSEKSRLLEESERLSKTLLDSMSHELRTPIAVIQSAADNLVKLGDAGQTRLRQQMVAEISEAAERLDRLVENALEISRLESGAVKPVLNDCDPADLVNLCVAETEKRLARHRVSARIDPNLPMARMDFVLTRYALTNLLSNAASHTPEGTEVKVEASMDRGELKLSVADRGPGIETALLPRVFDKFTRAPNAQAGGIGLGLYLVKGFIEAQHGTVTAENRTEGGAEFVIRLPLHRVELNERSAVA